MAEASRKEAEREQQGMEHPEPSLGERLGQIGVLGWMVVVPTLLGLFAGRWFDRTMGTGIFFSAPGLMIGAGVGLALAWRWMHQKL